jgi:uncharacterized protein YbjQ (UPF0145 family)
MSNDEIIVTTGDIRDDYTIIGPVYYQISNKGLFGSELGKKIKEYKKEIDELKKNHLIDRDKSDWGFLYGELSVGQTDFDKAFYIAVKELSGRARTIGANAIIHMKQDINLDTNGFQYFYLQMYGTAIKINKHIADLEKAHKEELNITSNEIVLDKNTVHVRENNNQQFDYTKRF